MISLGIITLVMLALHGPEVLSNTLSSVGLLTFAKHLQVSSQATTTPALHRAEHLLRQAVLWDPTNVSARRGLGLTLEAEGRKDEAITLWQSVEGIAEEFIQRGEQARSAERYQEALMWYRWAAILEPGFGDPWYYAGLIWEKLDQWEEAFTMYDQGVKVGAFRNVAESSLYYRLGVIYQQRQSPPQLDRALTAYDAALAVNSFRTDWEAADTYYRRGIIYSRQGRDPSDLIDEFRQAVARDPKHKWAHLKLGHVLFQAYGDVSLAEQEIEEALDLWPHDESLKWPYRFLGDIYRDAGLIEEAIAAYQTALHLDADDEYVKEALYDLDVSSTEADRQR